jgi:hypothetical protein
MRYPRFLERIDGCARITAGDIQKPEGPVHLADQVPV